MTAPLLRAALRYAASGLTVFPAPPGSKKSYKSAKHSGWPDEDPVIIITKANIDDFIDRLCDVCGIPFVGDPKPASRRQRRDP